MTMLCNNTDTHLFNRTLKNHEKPFSSTIDVLKMYSFIIAVTLVSSLLWNLSRHEHYFQRNIPQII